MKQEKIKKMMKQIEHALTAVSFAEEGQFEAAQNLLRDSRRVLLAVREHQIDRKTLKYAMNSSTRVGAELDILYLSSSGGNGEPQSDPVISGFLAELEEAGVRYRILHRTGCMKQEIIDHTSREKDILFAVIESPGSLNAECSARRDSRLAELWKNLRCPLVVVMDEAGG